jgi:hypothetical protein
VLPPRALRELGVRAARAAEGACARCAFMRAARAAEGAARADARAHYASRRRTARAASATNLCEVLHL